MDKPRELKEAHANFLGLPEGWQVTQNEKKLRFRTPAGTWLQGTTKLLLAHPEFKALDLSLKTKKFDPHIHAPHLVLAEGEAQHQSVSKRGGANFDEAVKLGLPEGWRVSYESKGKNKKPRTKFLSPQGKAFFSVPAVKEAHPELGEQLDLIQEMQGRHQDPEADPSSSPNKRHKGGTKTQQPPAGALEPLQEQTVCPKSPDSDSDSSSSSSSSSSTPEKPIHPKKQQQRQDTQPGSQPTSTSAVQQNPKLSLRPSSSVSSSASTTENSINAKEQLQHKDTQQGHQSASTPAGQSKLKLPPGWSEHWSDEFKIPFYWNSRTDESSWTVPLR
eukprot:gnl/TRDRNA2_/TRDRNA2_200000_c0_seq1.p1 gnl/TRDRNA2_/TRDRNA2_200000_c0~~gnl/TRDRNA2_/TRDRNA2_200000_c0_seq1.p1  ORF type:complete len:331 (-),score=33.45 gnl/TRDRNA2_/TRDRNA2_200000_c0_seq1:286-1278(-)